MEKPLRVLIVDDSEDDALLLASVLKDGGFQPVFDRVDTSEGLKAALLGNDWDCIISDYKMPQFNGLAALREFREHGIDIPFILVSGAIGEDIAVAAMKAGAHDYVMKDKLMRLVPALQRELADAEVRRKERRTEEELRESEEELRRVVESMQEIVYVGVLGEHETTGPLRYVSKQIETILGISVEEFVQDPSVWPNSIHPDDAASVTRQTEEAVAKHTRIRREYRCRKKGTEEYRWLEDDFEPVIDEDGNAVGFFGVARDITERKIAEEKLRRSEEQFRLIAENVADMIAVLDLEGRRIYNSPSYKSILGDLESLRGTDSFQEIHPDDVARVKQVFQEAVRTGIGQRIEYRFLQKDGSERTIDSKGSVIRDSDGTISSVVVVSRDVTEEKKLAAQFLRAQRMESIGTLAGGIAHDLNNVLAPIMMAIEVLRDKVSDPGGQEILNLIETSAKRGADIVRQVLGFGRGVKGERIVVQLKHVVNELIKISSGTFPKSIEIKTDIPRDLWTVSADPTQMHQVLLNMMVNARDAMPGGGTLTISAENIHLDETYSRMHLEAKPGAYVCIVITDTGTGIPADIREKIFEPFFTTKEIGMGTGLGLSTTLAIVRSHEGFINLYSEVGNGTTFRIYIPATGTTSTVAAASEEADLPMGNGELILIIDDEASIREITKETLQAHGYRVVTANDGAEGVAVFAENKKRILAVITDIIMPVMDGTAAILALKKINPDVKIIAASGLTTKGQITALSDSNVQAFLTKPYTAEKLLKTLAEVLR
jgi:PAS domain S-box-containing protein